MLKKADPSEKLYTRMRLWELNESYVVEPSDGSSGSCLSVSRLDGSISLLEEVPNSSGGGRAQPKVETIFGVVGILKLFAGSYLFVIMERECVGSYLGHPIFKVSKLKVLPCDLSVKNSPEEQKKMESEFSLVLKVAEKTPGLYFSYDVNLTLSTQHLNDLGDESRLLPLWRQAEPRFLWNNYILEVLIDNKLDHYMLPVIQGTFQNFQSTVGKDTIDVTLIGRRCTRRTDKLHMGIQLSSKYNSALTDLMRQAWTRMWRRGADSDGYVANFVESEQIVHVNGFTASFVQVRGSMPFMWEQVVDLTYKPKFEIVKPEEASRVAERHFLDLRKKYGNVIAVDLVNKGGGEGRLCEMFASAVQNILSDDMRYVHFDFHHICGHIHFERLSMLYDQIEDFLVKNRYFLINDKGEKVEAQIGVVRTNCIDCLDRTNVTQSMIGRKMLELQLQRLGVFDADRTISSHSSFDDCFKILWANHGDDISLQYSGTPALKGDFVRYGKRTKQGIINDGIYALTRYYLNNFVDGTKQDAVDLLQGHYIVSVSRDMAPTKPQGRVEAIASFRLALALILMGFFFAIMSLRRVRVDVWHVMFSLFWAGLSLAIAGFVKANGRVFCNRPRLHKPAC